MKKIERRAIVCVVLAMALAVGMGIFVFRYFTSAGKWASSAFNRHLYDASGVPVQHSARSQDTDRKSVV